MSTTTNFKRIALVAVAALGLGVLSSVPSTAAISTGTLTLSAPTATQETSDTLTASAATVTLTYLADGTTDSVAVTAGLLTAPSGNTVKPVLALKETSTAFVDTDTTRSVQTDAAQKALIGETTTANIPSTVRPSEAGLVTAVWYVYLDGPAKAGAYEVTLTPSVPSGSSAGSLAGAVARTLTINVTAKAALDTTASAANSTAYIYKGAGVADGIGNASLTTSDSTVAVSATSTGTQAAHIYVTQKNAANLSYAKESMTATISGAGILGKGTRSTGSSGRSLTLAYNEYVTVWPDGTAGIGTITITGAVSGVTLTTKTVKFTGTLATYTASANKAILAVGAATSNQYAVKFTAEDSGKNVLADEPTPVATGVQDVWYAFSSDTTVATVGALTYVNDSGTVSVAGVKAGTATITIGNASTLAASTIKSTPVTVRVGSTSIASVKVAFDKATYAPGELAVVTVALYDSTNQLVVPGTYELWATGEVLATDKNFSQGTFLAAGDTSVTTAGTTATGTTAGMATYKVYMPNTAGKVTVTGTLAKTGSTTLAPIGTLVTAAAIQGTEVSASVTVSDSGSAALAAVTALATTVASLRTLIVTLTNLVLKIQKKVKA